MCIPKLFPVLLPLYSSQTFFHFFQTVKVYLLVIPYVHKHFIFSSYLISFAWMIFRYSLFCLDISTCNCNMLVLDWLSSCQNTKSWRHIMFCAYQSALLNMLSPVGKPRTDSVPPTVQSQIPKSRDVTLFFLDMTLYEWAAMNCLRRHPMCFYWISS